jgi:hypothetical protein
MLCISCLSRAMSESSASKSVLHEACFPSRIFIVAHLLSVGRLDEPYASGFFCVFDEINPWIAVIEGCLEICGRRGGAYCSKLMAFRTSSVVQGPKQWIKILPPVWRTDRLGVRSSWVSTEHRAINLLAVDLTASNRCKICSICIDHLCLKGTISNRVNLFFPKKNHDLYAEP